MDNVLEYAMKHSSALSCEAAALLIASKPLDARKKLYDSMNILKAAVSGVVCPQQATTSPGKAMSGHDFVQAKVPWLSSERCYVYDYAMLFCEDNGTPTDHSSIVIRLAAVTYNLAVASHQLGIATDSREELQSAIVSYHCAAMLLLTAARAMECTNLTCFAMAALNNEACLQLELGQSDQYYHLLELITRTTRTLGEVWSPSQRQYIQEFLLNLKLPRDCALQLRLELPDQLVLVTRPSVEHYLALPSGSAVALIVQTLLVE